MTRYLSLKTVLQIHEDLIDTDGGMQGVRDMGLLQSAMEMPRASFFGVEQHPTLFDKAAAYLFHIARNHPFLDGNKRTSAASALLFLELNGAQIKIDMAAYEDLVVDAAEGKISKTEVATFFADC